MPKTWSQSQRNTYGNNAAKNNYCRFRGDWKVASSNPSESTRKVTVLRHHGFCHDATTHSPSVEVVKPTRPDEVKPIINNDSVRRLARKPLGKSKVEIFFYALLSKRTFSFHSNLA